MREEGAKYKVIPINGNGYSGSLVAIYEPQNIELALASTYGYRGETLDVIAKNNEYVKEN